MNKKNNIKTKLIKSEKLYRYIKNKKLFISSIMVLVVVFLALFGPLIMPYGYEEMNTGERLSTPNINNIFGTDHFGRDLFSRVIYGTRLSLFISISVVVLVNIFGIFVGSISGYIGGKFDLFIMRIVDTMFTIPWVLIAMIIAIAMGRSVLTVIISLSIIFSPQMARVVRGCTLSIKAREFVLAGKISGESAASIILRYILPNSLGPIMVQSTMIFVNAMLAEAALSYLGYGVAPPVPSWGLLLQDSTKYYMGYPYLVYFPGFAIILTVLFFSFLGDGLRDLLDPKFNPL